MELTIEAKARASFGRQNIKLRRQGILPAVLYGPSAAATTEGARGSVNLQVSSREFDKIYRQAGENTLINLVVGGKSKKVLIHDVAKHFMKNEVIHVDFYEVDLTRKIHAKIPLHFVGTAPAVKELGGILLKNLSEIEVEALPADLPPSLEINLEILKTFDVLVRVGDLRVPQTVKVLGRPEEMVVSVQPPRTEAELAELDKSTVEAEKAAVEALAPKEAAAGEESKEPDKADLSAESVKAGKTGEKTESEAKK